MEFLTGLSLFSGSFRTVPGGSKKVLCLKEHNNNNRYSILKILTILDCQWTNLDSRPVSR